MPFFRLRDTDSSAGTGTLYDVIIEATDEAEAQEQFLASLDIDPKSPQGRQMLQYMCVVRAKQLPQSAKPDESTPPRLPEGVKNRATYSLLQGLIALVRESSRSELQAEIDTAFRQAIALHRLSKEKGESSPGVSAIASAALQFYLERAAQDGTLFSVTSSPKVKRPLKRPDSALGQKATLELLQEAVVAADMLAIADWLLSCCPGYTHLPGLPYAMLEAAGKLPMSLSLAREKEDEDDYDEDDYDDDDDADYDGEDEEP